MIFGVKQRCLFPEGSLRGKRLNSRQTERKVEALTKQRANLITRLWPVIRASSAVARSRRRDLGNRKDYVRAIGSGAEVWSARLPSLKRTPVISG
jgi:hypothetical protein